MMRSFALSELLEFGGGSLHGRDVHCSSVSTDTRTLKKGDLFVALKGQNFDAERFLIQAQDAGACAAVVQEVAQELDLPQLQVSDTQRALADIAALQRQEFSKPIIALTGSVGKTSCKEMLSSILSQLGSVMATRGNLNNEIGVPLTLLRLDEDHDYAVIELGAGRKGDIDYLNRIVRPDVALVTTVAPAHLESIGSLEQIAETKAEIYTSLPAEGAAVINLDNSYTRSMTDKLRGQTCLTFSCQQSDATVTGSAVEKVESESGVCYRFRIGFSGEQATVQLKVPGRHSTVNALAAAACAFAVGAPMTSVVAGLEAYQGFSQRLQCSAGFAGASIIDDSYNANPASVKAAIDVLADSRGTRVLVLGEMAELGAETELLHTEIGQYALQAGVDYLLGVGSLTQFSCDAFGSNARHFSNKPEGIDYCKTLVQQLKTPAVVLVKGSRSAAMEEFVHALMET